ncbi:hypothetical protein NLJ89_g3052 [Agrocybe chaxingu]|uniref:Integrase core domain-containing protein n=1 Tax=Agrocybe chaxingu TaxID=84603 RepID=A0A9W8K369_9AGAR|nr:hypothetical protein NLJ89_g3052 [Agrocybe chaxingu]
MFAGDDILEPAYPIPQDLPPDIQEISQEILANEQISEQGVLRNPVSRHHSTISDRDLDDLIIRLRFHFQRAGISMLDGMLRRLGHRVQRERIRQALLRIDPVRRIFERIRIRRRQYSVAGPNALWHHDGQHGLIRNNNSGNTVLGLFLTAAAIFGVPSRLRGDHGTENILVAAWMEERRGGQRGSYIWGRSVHNVRIERLWVDVTAQIGSLWANFFTILELRHGLDINNANHIWLLHHLFLPLINIDLTFFAEAWNEHPIQIRDGPNRSPMDLFGFDMAVHGVRGDPLDEMMSREELEVYGIDWEGLRNDRLLESRQVNNGIEEGVTSWVGESGPPARLNEVIVDSPDNPLTDEALTWLNAEIAPWMGGTDDDSRILLWAHALAAAQSLSNIF